MFKTTSYVLYRWNGGYEISKYYGPSKRKELYKIIKAGYIVCKNRRIPRSDIISYGKTKESLMKIYPQYFI